ncbi:magnesium/cobalt transporter CorA [Salinigranum halophilum]|jgi:magnesium transporter|uniref:magnesium/cobalt transporter CorA n=1 Tax=Salinigranum halophilum TaxID=2565931 RepID=UPI0010A853FD|nr:magnesium/cobalt transporter CorA [Salinigranum halophilum]
MTVSAVVYTESGVDSYDDLERARDADGTTWVRAWDAGPDELDRVASVFGIHHLSVEDVQRDIRPKTEEFASHTFVLVKTASLRTGETTFHEELRTQQVGLFIGRDWLVSMSTAGLDAVEEVWASVQRGDARILRLGADFAAYRVIDRVVDGYFLVLDETEDLIEEIEDGVLAGPSEEVLVALNDVRRDLLSVRKVLWPTREAAAILARGDPDYIQPATEKYYRDVYDHLVQLVDLTETYRDLARGARDIYLNSLSQSTNEVMKTLTVVATLLLPLTFVVGVYGMNFSGGPYNMPELGWRFGYPAVMLGMASVTVILVAYFRQQRWL